jgi:hypothetical protein
MSKRTRINNNNEASTMMPRRRLLRENSTETSREKMSTTTATMLNFIIFMSILFSSIIWFDEVAAFQGYQQYHFRERRPLSIIRLGLVGHQQKQQQQHSRRRLLSPLQASLLSSTDQYLNSINNHQSSTLATFPYGDAATFNLEGDSDSDGHRTVTTTTSASTNLPLQHQGVYELTSEEEYKYVNGNSECEHIIFS